MDIIALRFYCHNQDEEQLALAMNSISLKEWRSLCEKIDHADLLNIYTDVLKKQVPLDNFDLDQIAEDIYTHYTTLNEYINTFDRTPINYNLRHDTFMKGYDAGINWPDILDTFIPDHPVIVSGDKINDDKTINTPLLKNEWIKGWKKGFYEKYHSLEESNKQKIFTPRNPMAYELLSGKYKSRIEKSKQEKEQRKDTWNKKAKHKNKKLEENFVVGDEVVYNGSKGVIKIVNGPLDTMGIVVNGELKMVDKNNIKSMQESALTTTLTNIQKLAGISLNEEVDYGDDNEPLPIDLYEPDEVNDDYTVEVSDACEEILKKINEIQSLISDIKFIEAKLVTQSLTAVLSTMNKLKETDIQ